MSKSIYWIIGLLILIAGAGAYLYFNRSTPTTPSETTPYTNPYSYYNSGTPPAGTVSTTTTSSGPTIQLPTATGGSITAHDPTTDPSTKTLPTNPGHYYLGNTPDPSSPNPPTYPYEIEYIASTHYFNIALLQEPLGASRTAAEQYLMQHLGITQEQMCNLKYMVSVPSYVNGAYTGTSLGFSFCQGAVALP